MVKNPLKTTKKTKQPKIKEQVHTLVINEARFTTQSEVSISDNLGEGEPDRPFKEMMDIIDHDPRLELSLDTYVQMILGSGIKVTADTKKLEKKIVEWFDDIDFENKLEDGLYSYCGSGNMFFEVEPKAHSDFVEIPIDSMVGVVRDRKGNIRKYIQDINNKTTKLDPKDIIHFKFTNARREIWGRGLFHSVINGFTDPVTNVRYQAPIFQMKDIEDGLGKIIQNYASPIMMFHFKDAGENFIEKQGEVIKTARPGAKILTDKEFDIKIFEVKGDSKFEKYIEHIQRDVIEPGSQFPLQFFNAGFTARAASESTDSVLIRKVKRIQKRLANQISEFMILPFLRKTDKSITKDKFSIKFNLDNKTEFNIPDLITLFRDNVIKRSEIRENILKHTTIQIDPSDMEDLMPITSVTPTDKIDPDNPVEPKEIPKEDPEAKKLQRAKKTKIDIEEESFKKILEGIDEDKHECMEACLRKKKDAGIPIDKQAIAICMSECEKKSEAKHKREKKKEQMESKKLDILDKIERRLEWER